MKISDELMNLKREKRSKTDIRRTMDTSLIRRYRVHNYGLYQEAIRARRLKEYEIDALENALRIRDPLDPDYQAYVDAWNEAQNVLADLEYLCVIAYDNYHAYL